MDKSKSCVCGNNIFWYFGDRVRCVKCYVEMRYIGDSIQIRHFEDSRYKEWEEFLSKQPTRTKRPVTIDELVYQGAYQIKMNNRFLKMISEYRNDHIYVGTNVSGGTIEELISEGAKYNTTTEPHIWRSFEVDE